MYTAHSTVLYRYVVAIGIANHTPEPKKVGGAGYRSPYLSHAKRALYHLSYTPDSSGDRWPI